MEPKGVRLELVNCNPPPSEEEKDFDELVYGEGKGDGTGFSLDRLGRDGLRTANKIARGEKVTAAEIEHM